jgi:hypothetical protein
MSMISNADFNRRFAEFLESDGRGGFRERHDLTDDEEREFSEQIYRILNTECTSEERTKVLKRIAAVVEECGRAIRQQTKPAKKGE